MRWFDRHIDRALETWALGGLSSAQASRLLRHAHACEPCGARYERWALAHRALETGGLDRFSSAEHAGLEAAGLEAALAAASEMSPRSRWQRGMVLGAAVVAVCLGVVLIPPHESEWRVRGAGTVAPDAVLRLFCAAPEHSLRELAPGQACPPGARLAFAVGAEPPLSHVAIRILGREKKEEAFPITGRPGKEAALEWTVPLPDTPGTVEVEATFTSTPEVGLHAPQAPRSDEAIVRRQLVRIEELP
ncbi:hypothetical protein [Hyalangium versicolor]|uniref:hypothetical protein n=1 Tax=Hyalangium versicolor TaxID=2861190 RepID=UPI001CCBBCBD|nr:hypothetical protein [Hyalangium versicolor]